MSGPLRRLAVLGLAAFLLAAPAARADEDEVAVGLPAPAFSAKTLNPDVAGRAWLALDHFVGAEPEDAAAKVVLLSFFASWCAPCQKELPFLVQLDRTYRDRGLRVISVNVDRDEAGLALAKAQLAKAGVRHPAVLDRFNIVARRYLGASAPLPSVFVVRRDGTIQRIERGYAADVSTILLAEVRAALGLVEAAAR